MISPTAENHHALQHFTQYVQRVATRAVGGLLLLALLAAALLFPAPAATGTPEFLLFLGRFHPLLLHLPIGLLVLLPVLHLVACFRPPGALRPAIVAVLWLCAGSTFAAALCGLLLSQESGYAGATMELHRRLALILTVLSVLLLVSEAESHHRGARRANFARWMRRVYRALLPLALVFLGLAAHLGATLTHGSTFLTQHLPRPMKAWLAGSTSAAVVDRAPSESAYLSLVAPILEARCGSCHGLEKAKGGLRLQNVAAILAGGDRQREDHLPAVVPGHADASLLIRAICLPGDDDAHMPPAGKPQLTAAEIATLRWWIDACADPQTLASKAFAIGPAAGPAPPIPRS